MFTGACERARVAPLPPCLPTAATPLRPRCPMTLRPTATDRQQASRIAHAPVPILRAPRPRPCWLGAGGRGADQPHQPPAPCSRPTPSASSHHAAGHRARGLGVLGSWGIGGLGVLGFGHRPLRPCSMPAGQPHRPPAPCQQASPLRPLPVRKGKAADIQPFVCFTEQFA